MSFCEEKANTSSFTLADGKELLQMVPVPQSHLRKSLNNSTFLLKWNSTIEDVHDHSITTIFKEHYDKKNKKHTHTHTINLWVI